MSYREQAIGALAGQRSGMESEAGDDCRIAGSTWTLAVFEQADGAPCLGRQAGGEV